MSKADKKARQIIEKSGVRYVIETKGREKAVISRWLSKPVYIALKESGNYMSFMAAGTLDEADRILGNKKSTMRKRRY